MMWKPARWLFWSLLGEVLLFSSVSCASRASSGPTDCPPADPFCPLDKLGYEAIRSLHAQIDDDKDGQVELAESDDFIRDELKYEDGFERHTSFHGNDKLISVDDLWRTWTISPVYNWTVDDTIDWLVTDVELPQYAKIFKVNAVDGHTLPRIAANNNHFVSGILGIKNPVHKQKLTLKAMDVVLFGPPKKAHNYIKDLALVASLFIAVGGCWLAYVQHKFSQSHLKKVMKDLDTLQLSEDALTDLQVKLQQAEEEHKTVLEEKQTLEKNMKNEIAFAKTEADRLRTTREATEEEISRLRLAEEELEQVRNCLRQAEKELEEGLHRPLSELHQYLQITYEIETRHYDTKREAAEKQLTMAKEMCEKIKKKRAAFMGSLRIAHSTSLDDTDKKILGAKSALEEVKNDLQERLHRWRQIERICGFQFILNPSIPGPQRRGSQGVMVPLSVDDTDEDVPPGFMQASSALFMQSRPGLMRHITSTPALGSFSSLQNHGGGAGGSELRERRSYLPPAFSSSSLNMQSTPNIANLGRSRTIDSASSHDSDGPHSAESNGGVSFHLGDNHNPPIFEEEDNVSNNSSTISSHTSAKGTFHKSVSLQDGHPRGRTQSDPTMPLSQSESALDGGPHHRRPTSTIKPRTPTVEEETNSSSQDSLETGGGGERKERKKKNILGLLKRDSDKTKSS